MSENTTNNPPGGDNCEALSNEQFENMTLNFKTSLDNNGDTESVWVSIYDLLDLISHNRANGIRIYNGRYGQDHEEFPGRHNLIFVATRDADNPHCPCSADSADLMGGENLEPPFEQSKFTGLSINKGRMCPPRCRT